MKFSAYDKIIVFFSGGKDSVACVLSLLDAGIKPEKIELHHHCVDGREGELFMDWACTEDYCRAFAKAFNIPIYFSWKVGGFEGELNRENQPTGAIAFEDAEHNVVVTGGTSKDLGTRLKFPRVTSDLSTRWCSSYLKVDVGGRLITKQMRFSEPNKKYLVITGERAQESKARANYKEFEKYRADNRNGKRVVRYLDQYRLVHKWREERIWDIIKSYGVNPHPAYHCGFGRTSCMLCIFGSVNQWATIREYAPDRFQKVLDYEKGFGCTINNDGKSFIDILADKGKPYDIEEGYFEIANSKEYKEPIFLDNWYFPNGAFGENCGAM